MQVSLFNRHTVIAFEVRHSPLAIKLRGHVYKENSLKISHYDVI